MRPFSKKYVYILVLAIIGVLLIIAGTSYAFFTNTASSDTDYVLTTGTLSITYQSNNNVINLNKAYPMSSTDGLNTTPYSFTITNTGMATKYRVRLEEATTNTLELEYVKVALYKDDVLVLEPVKLSNLDRLVLESNALLAINDEVEYKLKMWIDLSTPSSEVGKTFGAKVIVDAIQDGEDTDNIPIDSVNNENINLSGFALKIYQNSTKINTAPTLAEDDGYAIGSSECNWTSPNYVCTARDQAGLYSMDVTDGFGGSNGKTYYFRGNVDNNYVTFGKWNEDLYYGWYYYGNGISALKRFSSLESCQNDSSYHNDCTKVHGVNDDIVWRIIRINEDGTIRLMLNDEVGTIDYDYNSNSATSINDMYYTNSTFKTLIDTWYNTTIGNNQTYASKVVTGNYFCEAAKVSLNDTYETGNAVMTLEEDYLPDLKCETDGNNHGLVSGSVGLLNYDELRLAGGGEDNNVEYFLYKRDYWTTMSPAGMDTENYYDDETGDPINWASVWALTISGDYSVYGVQDSFTIRPVINIRNDVTVTGTGTSTNPYSIQ